MHMNISNIENTNIFVLPINKVYAEAKSMEARFCHSKKKKKRILISIFISFLKI